VHAPVPTDRQVERFSQDLDRAVGADGSASDIRDVAVQGIDGVMVNVGELRFGKPR
jgi:hypothetical protein